MLEVVEPDQATRAARLEQLLDEFHIARLRDAPAMALSGGERRRCEIARALAAKPSIMLLDEPFAGIDPISIADIRDLVVDLRARDIGVLITDHNVRETLEIVDRACIIYDGRVLFEGTPEALVADETVRRRLSRRRVQLVGRASGATRMSLGPRLDLRQSQSLVMTPQLQQAIKLLALTNLELEAFIGEEIEKNPLLDGGGEEVGRQPRPTPGRARDAGADELIAGGDATADAPLDVDYAAETFHHDGPTDSSADAPAGFDGGGSSGGSGGDRARASTSTPSPPPAPRWPTCSPSRPAAAFADPVDLLIARHLIDQIDDAGYLAADAVADVAEPARRDRGAGRGGARRHPALRPRRRRRAHAGRMPGARRRARPTATTRAWRR